MATSEAESTQSAERPFSKLSWAQRRLLALLGVPSLGLAFAVTVTSTYVPVLVEKVSGPVMVGVLIGGEGFFGIFVPLLVGGRVDRHRTVAGRLGWLLAGAAVLAASVTAVGVLGVLKAGLWGFGIGLTLLYLGYYTYLAPYWALYPDLVPSDQSGRSRSAEGVFRVTGVGLALIGGGVLLTVSPGLPFFIAAVLVVAVTGILTFGLRRRRADRVERRGDERRAFGDIRQLLTEPGILRLVIANSLWNFALAALRAFVVLFFTAGLGKPSSFVSAIIFPLVAVGIAIAAPLSGWLADKFGHIRLMTAALALYGGTMWIPGVIQYSWVAVLIPIVSAGAATVMTLPLSVLMRLLPEDKHGAASGLFGLSRGVGGTLGPIVAGAAILAMRSVLPGTHGYGAMWFVGSAALLVSIPVLRGLRGDERL
ncbi:MAG TPA: MFS transporter [Nocardioidaceae bacterium]|nr:MFS transporter [Nocardioidaceae bacterium]